MIVGTARKFEVKRAIACYEVEVADDKDIWDLQRTLNTELSERRRVKIIIAVGCDRLQVNEVD